QVFMHSAIDRPDENIFFEFKSSPYGSHGHSYDDQNCFNLAAFNEPIFIRSGYYLCFGDPHHAGWTMQTKAHNGVLVDGTGQPNSDITAHGELLRFDRGTEYAFTAGEAKWAYREVTLDRFVRNCLWLKPNLFFIYDQLRAPEPHT
ncbi:MAG: heparinase II/III family protein, partial [Armatimonadota bacterium]